MNLLQHGTRYLYLYPIYISGIKLYLDMEFVQEYSMAIFLFNKATF